MTNSIGAIDLFCGAGGLSSGLRDAGISVIAGVDIDPACRYPFESNIGGLFLELDVRSVTAEQLLNLWSTSSVRLLAGCAPCQPFSPYRRGVDTSDEEQWPLLSEFGRLVRETRPEVVTMENVARIQSTSIFAEFVNELQSNGYHVAWRSCYGPHFGVPQSRHRLVLLASTLGEILVPEGPLKRDHQFTVRETIGELPALAHGTSDPDDPLHKSRSLSEVNLRRIRASRPGGTWQDWPDELRSPCHRKESGSSFRNVYSRMEWDKPSPTITTLAYNFGTGRFGHPEQDRSISLREAAMLQGFERTYKLVPADQPIRFVELGRLIGNAVPPPLARAVGAAIIAHVEAVEG